jgi:hypothetical protein
MNLGDIMKGIQNINITLSQKIFEKIENYAQYHKISPEKVIQIALREFFDLETLLENKERRKKIWDIIDAP